MYKKKYFECVLRSLKDVRSATYEINESAINKMLN